MNYNDLTMIYQTLINDTPVTTLVSTAIYNAMLIPEDESSKDTINYYVDGNFDGGLSYSNRSVSINCRSAVENTSKSIASAVFTALNRTNKEYNSIKYFNKVSVLPTIPPLDDSDVYNTPLSVQIRGNS